MKKASVITSIVFVAALAAVGQKNQGVAADFIDAWNSHDVEKVVPVFTDALQEDLGQRSGDRTPLSGPE